MRVLTTYLPATSGTAELAGFDVRNHSLQVRQKIGYLPEKRAAVPEMRVEEYLELRPSSRGCRARTGRRAWNTAWAAAASASCVRRLVGTLSKGYRQRVGWPTP